MTLKLFVADDSETIHKVISLAFDDTDTVVEFAKSGDIALDAIHSYCPDIVLADICLPGINGYELCARMKHNPELASIPVVLLVGTFEPFDEAEASRAGYAASLTKPFDTSELIEIIQNHVGRENMLSEKGSETNFDAVETGVSNSNVLNEKAFKDNIPVTRQAWDSFLGTGRVLDVFDASEISDAEHRPQSNSLPIKSTEAGSGAPTAPLTVSADQLSDEAMEKIVNKVVERMSADIITEIAWEVVPELSEILIKRSIEENNKSD